MRGSCCGIDAPDQRGFAFQWPNFGSWPGTIRGVSNSPVQYPRRSCLAVPASSERKLEKAPALGADELVLDLEDAVAPAVKNEARAIPAFRGLRREDVPSSGRPGRQRPRHPAESLRRWVRQAEADEGKRQDLITSDERERLKALEREVKELRRANEILKAASVFFATKLEPHRPK